MLITYFNDIVFDEKGKTTLSFMGTALLTLTDTNIKNLSLRAVFIGVVVLFVLVFAKSLVAKRKFNSIFYLLILGTVLFVSTLLLAFSLVHVQDTITTIGGNL